MAIEKPKETPSCLFVIVLIQPELLIYDRSIRSMPPSGRSMWLNALTLWILKVQSEITMKIR